jgi:hypothetical protein
VPNNHFERIARQIIKKGIKVDFNTGLDIRLIDDEKARLLKQMHVTEPRFAWDNIEDEYLVLRGIETLRRNGINRSIFYVLVGYEGTFEDCLYRVNKLRDLGQRVYVMPYERVELFKKDIRYLYLRRWGNARMIFASTKYEEFVENHKGGEAHLSH